jgi:hypothetical protein
MLKVSIDLLDERVLLFEVATDIVVVTWFALALFLACVDCRLCSARRALAALATALVGPLVIAVGLRGGINGLVGA